MNGKAPRQWLRLIAVLTILSLWINLLPPPLPVNALAPSLPDYSAQLLALSGTLERDKNGDLRFPYPVNEPAVDIEGAQAFELPIGFGWLTRWLRSLGWASTRPSLAAHAPQSPARLRAPPQRQLDARQNANRLRPHITNASPAQAPLGETALFAALLPDPTVLATELGFADAQIQHLQRVIEHERTAITVLDVHANRILNNEQATLSEKRAALAALDYNGQIQTILRSSQTELQNQLGVPRYAQLVAWFNGAWQRVIAQRTTARAAAATEPCPTFTVFATRSFHTDYSADLPDQYIKFANQGIEYSHGYTNTTVYSVSVQLNDQIIHNVVITDAGPHNEDDNYWNRADDPLHPRRLFTDLPQGVPEAEAAYFDNYNNGRDQFGRIVTNPAGINLSTQAANQLGMVGNQWVTVTFPWDCTPAPPRSPPLERSWGATDWSKAAATLVNPVTGNQGLWARDLYVPAPGLPVDFVRYYNSLDRADGIFGRGWSSEFDMRVYPQDNGAYKVRYRDGQRALFRPTEGGDFVGELGVFDHFAVADNGFVLTLADEQISYRFDGNGRLQSITDLADNQITLAYTGGNPTTITDAAGRSFTLTFDGNGHVTRIQDPLGRVVTYAYAAPRLASVNPDVAALLQTTDAALTSVTDPNQGTTSYEYDPATQALNKAVDGDGITFVENLYDEQGRVREQRNADGKTGKMTYDAQNRRSTFTDNLGNQTVYVFDRRLRVVEEIDALGNRITYAYNDRDQLTAKTDKRGHTWRYAYDERGNPIRREDPIDEHSAEYYATDVTTWAYNDRNQPTRMTTGRGEVTRYEYDDRGNLTKVIAPNGATTTSVFNSKGQMIRLTDAEGRVTRYGYDERGNRNEIIDANGGVTRFTYDNGGRVVAETDAENHTTRYEYDGNGNLTKVTDPLENVTRSEYNRNNLVTQVTDRRGAIYRYRYDKELNLVAETDPLGHEVHYEYDAMHNRTALIDANGNRTSYTYDKLYRIASITEPLGGTTRYTYDENGNVLSVTDALEQTTRYTYDALNRRIFVTDALGNKTELIYDQLDRVTQTVDAYGAISRYTYDRAGDLVQIINPLGAKTTYGYDLVHNRTRTIDPNGHANTVAYDRLSRPVAYTDALGQVTRPTYDRIGNTMTITDTNGNVSTFVYDANAQLTRSIDALGAQVSYTYDEEGNQRSRTDANGHTTQMVYDLRGDVTAITDTVGNTARFTYDANGNQISQTDANGHVTRNEYGAGDLLVRTLDPLQHPILYEYDLLGRLIRATDANGKSTIYEYDALDRVVGVVDAKGQATRYTYDAVGNLTSLADANHSTTRFVYNALNLVVKEINALGHSWRYSYDGAGNLVAKVDGRDQAIRYDYDAADQLIRKNFPDGKAVIYQYDANGNRLQMADWNGVTTATYDAVDQITTVTDHKGRSVAYTYDGNGNPVGMIYPDQRAVRYHYDARNQLIGMADPDGRPMRYRYDAAGRLTSQVRPNHTRTDFAYDAADQLTSVHTTMLPPTGGETERPADAIIGNFDYSRDPAGNRTAVVATRPGDAPVTYRYGYDDIYQMVSATSDNGEALTYTYDAVGNRLNVQGTPELPTAPISTTYQYNAINAMLTAGNAMLTYDDNGNRVRSQQPLAETKYAELGLYGTLITDYTFDIEDRLVAVRESIYYGKTDPATDPGAVVMEADYSYDGDGRRIAKLVQTYNLQGGRLDVLLREYVYDGLDVATEYEYHNGVTTPDITNYYYANGEKVTLERRNADGTKKVYWYAYDALGSTTALLDAAGQVAAEYQSDDFGRLLTGNSLLNHYLFTGQEYDPETGLYHFFARYYDPNTGVWLSQDVQRGTAMNPGAWHRYAYVLNSPVNRVDALGYGWLDDLGDLANDYVVEPVKDAAEAVKEGAKDAAEAVDRYVVKPVKKAYDDVKEEVTQRYEQGKRWVKQTARDVNEHVIQPTRRALVSAAKSAREGVTKAADWVQEHKDTIAMVAGTVGAIAAGAAFCGVTAGIGCLVIAGVAGGALAAGGVQAGANVLDSSADTGVLDNIGRAALIGGATGGVDALTGGLAGKAFAAARPLVQRGATALGQRLASAARGVGAAAPRLGATGRHVATAARNIATAARGVSSAAQRGSVGLRNAVGRGVGCSFSAATPVLTAHGTQPISAVEVGDHVYAYHEVLGATGTFTVTAVNSHIDPAITALTIDGEQLETTPEHPFYTHERGWVAADDLWVGAQVYRADGRTGLVQRVTLIQHQQPMYNLTVAQAHTFFVGNGLWLVHNGVCDDLAFVAHAALETLPQNLRQTTVAVAKNQGNYVYAVRVGGKHAATLTQVAVEYLEKGGLKVFNPGKAHAEEVLIELGYKKIGISRKGGACKQCEAIINKTPGVIVKAHRGGTWAGPLH